VPSWTETELLDKYDECYEVAKEHSGRVDTERTKQLFLRWRSLNDLYYFGTAVQDVDAGVDAETGRKRIDSKFHGWLCDEIEAPEDNIILVPRDHLKTSWVRLYIMQTVLRDANRVRTAVFSKNQKLVVKGLADMKRRFAKPVMRSMFPDEIPEPGKSYKGWETSNQNQLTLRRFSDEGDPPPENQIEAWGQGTEITGNHYKLIVLDDIIDQKNCTTADQLQKIEEWVGFLKPILDPTGRFIVIGTRWHYDDVYARILEGVFPRKAVRQATEPGGLDDPASKPIYSYYTKKMLRAVRDHMRLTTGSDYLFSCQYYNNPIPKDDQMFPPPQRTYDTLSVSDTAQYYICVDPAHSVGDFSDRTAIAVGCVAGNGILYVVECGSFKETHNVIAQRLVALIDQYRPRKVGIEAGFHEDFQFIMRQTIQDYERQQGVELTVGEFVPMKVGNQFSKAERINRTLATFCRAHRVFIHESLASLMRQMDHFPKSKRDDEVDATAMLIPLSQSEVPSRYGYDVPSDTHEWSWSVQDLLDKRAKKDATWAGRFKRAG
jgi:hypothetical protein